MIYNWVPNFQPLISSSILGACLPPSNPFKILVDTPEEMLLPIYLHSDGTAVSEIDTAANCSITSIGQLTCSEDGSPIGIPLGATESLLQGTKGQDVVTGTWSVGDRGRLTWVVNSCASWGGEAEFRYVDRQSEVFAIFKGSQLENTTEAELFVAQDPPFLVKQSGRGFL